MKNQVILYDENTIDALEWPNSVDGIYAKNYLLPMVKKGTTAYVKNVQTKLLVLRIDDLVMPVTVNTEAYENSYVCSPYTHYVTYAIEELRELKDPLMSKILKVPLTLLGWVLKKLKVNRVVCINNWLLSTNLYPKISQVQLEAIIEALRKEFGDYNIVFRSLNPLTTPDLLANLEVSGFIKVASRRSYISNTVIPLKSRHKSIVQKDARLLTGNRSWHSGNALTALEKERILELYNQLYLEKYSKLNPQFTVLFIEEMIQKNNLECHVLKIDNVIQGVVGFFVRGGVMTTPYFGYNLDLPREVGLYRMLSSKLLEEAQNRQLILHQSSGAGEFKKSRGAEPIVEYSLVQPPKNGKGKWIAWLMLRKLSNDIAMPIIIRKGL